MPINPINNQTGFNSDDDSRELNSINLKGNSPNGGNPIIEKKANINPIEAKGNFLKLPEISPVEESAPRIIVRHRLANNSERNRGINERKNTSTVKVVCKPIKMSKEPVSNKTRLPKIRFTFFSYKLQNAAATSIIMPTIVKMVSNKLDSLIQVIEEEKSMITNNAT